MTTPTMPWPQDTASSCWWPARSTPISGRLPAALRQSATEHLSGLDHSGVEAVALQGTSTSFPRTWPDWLMR